MDDKEEEDQEKKKSVGRGSGKTGLSQEDALNQLKWKEQPK